MHSQRTVISTHACELKRPFKHVVEPHNRCCRLLYASLTSGCFRCSLGKNGDMHNYLTHARTVFSLEAKCHSDPSPRPVTMGDLTSVASPPSNRPKTASPRLLFFSLLFLFGCALAKTVMREKVGMLYHARSSCLTKLPSIAAFFYPMPSTRLKLRNIWHYLR